MSEKILLEMKNITKLFPGVKALDDVNLKVKEGSIHALVGENGAGKSTLMNVLSGIYPYGTYTGDIIYDGEECRFSKIRDPAQAFPISIGPATPPSSTTTARTPRTTSTSIRRWISRCIPRTSPGRNTSSMTR